MTTAHLHYLANIRLPTEKAHGLQIVQNCEALADHATITLHPARRSQPPALQNAPDPWTYYGVARNFAIRYVPCLDLFPLLGGRENRFSAPIFYTQTATYIMALLLRLSRAPQDAIYYSRDSLTLAALRRVKNTRRIKPDRQLFWEAHSLSGNVQRKTAQIALAKKIGGVIAVTKRLAGELVQNGVAAERVLVAPDGIQAARFAHLPTRETARTALNLPSDAFMIGYMGRLHTMNMSKGVDVLIAAIAQLPDSPLHLLLVGGPDDMTAQLREQWTASGLPGERFHSTGHIDPADVPGALAAFDVATMPFPWTEHFAHYASPIKLFEYMASGRPILATDLPSTAEIVTHEESALLVPPSDVGAMAGALARLYADANLRERLADKARRLVFEKYTWAARAKTIMYFVAQTQSPD